MSGYAAFNRTARVLLASDLELAGTLWARMKGLLGRTAQQFREGKGLWIEPSQGVHTIGMAFPIDVAYLDSTGRVIRMYRPLAPFRVAALHWRARSILELPAGTLIRTGTALGDLVEKSKSP